MNIEAAKKYFDLITEKPAEDDSEEFEFYADDYEGGEELSSDGDGFGDADDEDDLDDEIRIPERMYAMVDEADAEDAHVAGPGEPAGKYGLTHGETPCDSPKPEDCPLDRKATEADSVLGEVKKPRPVSTNLQSAKNRLRRKSDPQWRDRINRMASLRHGIKKARERGDGNQAQELEAALKSMLLPKAATEARKHNREWFASLPKAERDVRIELASLMAKRRNEMNPDKAEAIGEEIEDKKKELQELMGRRGSIHLEGRYSDKNHALHSDVWIKIKNGIHELLIKAAKAKSDGQVFSQDYTPKDLKRLCELKKALHQEAAREKLSLMDSERRGISEERTYQTKQHVIVVRWHDGQWEYVPEKMSAEANAFIVGEKERRKEVDLRYKEKKGANIKANKIVAQAKFKRRKRAQQMGISERMLLVAGEEYKEQTGAKVILEKPFKEWCAQNNIPIETWEDGERRELERKAKAVA